MAIFDAMFEFSDAQPVVGAEDAVYTSTNIIDMQAAGREMGAGEPVYLNVKVDTAVAEVEDSTTGACTLTVALRGDTEAPIDTNSIVVIQTKAFAEAELVDGAWLLRVALPVDYDANQYIGMTYVVAGAASAVGKVNAWLDHGPQSSYDTQVAVSNI